MTIREIISKIEKKEKISIGMLQRLERRQMRIASEAVRLGVILSGCYIKDEFPPKPDPKKVEV